MADFPIPLPRLLPWSGWFWSSGEDGQLRVQGCDDCGRLVHPPVAVCPVCHSANHSPKEMSGTATVVGVTVNYQQWSPAFTPPYAIAVVALHDDPTIRLTTNIRGCEPDEVFIGQEVQVLFEQHDDVWLPYFAPTGNTDPIDRVPAPKRPTVRAPLTDDRFEQKSVLSGIGKSKIGRN